MSRLFRSVEQTHCACSVCIVLVGASATASDRVETEANGRVCRWTEMRLQVPMSSVNRSKTIQAWTRFSFSRVTMRLIGLFLEPGAIRVRGSQLLIEQITHALLCFLQLIVFAIPDIIVFFIVAPIDAIIATLRTIPKEVQ